MSTRHARTADKAQNEKNTLVLKALLQQPGNKFCADCRRKDPRWASWNLGIFVCIRCSGIHRSMGTHISKVKSVDLDSWITPQIESMQQWGNERANMYWEANLKDSKPNESNMEMWIRSKYELKRWAMKGPVPEPTTLMPANTTTATTTNTATTKSASTSQASSPNVNHSAAATRKPKQTKFDSLDDFFGSSPSASPTNTTNTQSSPSSSSSSQVHDLFSSMNINGDDNATTTAANYNNRAASSQSKPQIDLKSIMSLYNKPPTAPSTTSFMTGNTYQQQLGGFSTISSSTTSLATANHNNNITINSNGNGNNNNSSSNNGWGSFVSQAPTAASQADSVFGSSQQQQQQPKKQTYDAFADLLG